MRRALVLTGLMAVVLMAAWGGPAMVSATPQTCTETCSGGSTLSCTVATGTCMSASGSVTCCGGTHDCVAINAYDACVSNCDAQHTACVNHCGGRGGSCLTNCNNALHTCLTNCGARPTTSWSC